MSEFTGCIGIDLGTTFSCVGVWENDNVKIIPNKLGENTTPSWVHYNKDGKSTVGQYAKNRHNKDNEHVVYDIKRFMGKRLNDDGVFEDIERCTYEIGSDKDDFVCVKIDNIEYKPEQISAEILKEMKKVAEDYLGKKVVNAVITVPAYFNDTQRSATKNAALLADLNCLRIINEPTAACLCYGIGTNDEQEKNVLVYDFGGGTLDVSIVNVQSGVFEVKATNGDTHLGGIDFDEALVEHIKQENTDIDFVYSKLRASCEKLKKELSFCDNALFMYGDDYEKEFIVHEFENICEKVFNRCIAPVYNVINDAEMEPSEIDEIVIVGGSTRIPKIQKMLMEYFNVTQLNKSVNPDEAVAYGAAVQGAILTKSDNSQKTKDIVLLDVIPLSLGVETSGGLMAKLIEKNSTLPTEKIEMFSTIEDDQTTVTIKIFEGERPFTEHNHLLGTFDLTGLEPMPRGAAKIEVTFSIDENGILSVGAVDKKTGMSNNVVIRNERLSQEEVGKMLRDAEKNIGKDEARKQVQEEYKSFTKYLHAMKQSINSEAAASVLSLQEISGINGYLIEVFRFLEENIQDLLIERLKEYREEVEKNIGPSVYRIYSGGRNNETYSNKIDENKILDTLNEQWK